MKKTKIVKKRRNPNDSTFRNINALKARVLQLETQFKILNKYLHTFGA